MFDTLLVANRGEIACRVIRSARAMGLRTVAVYSDADAHARHVALADRAVRIGAGPARESYLRIEAIVDACRASGAQAVHPGYGFLSENAAFARALRDAGLVFVGPTPEAIDALGNKSAAKRLAERIGVPCLPGYAGDDQSGATLLREARRVGAPLMIKAAAGGGGRGMRRCDDVGDTAALQALLDAARIEAQGAFGDGHLLLERLVEEARHVEVQVFGDVHGGCVHLGERDCSTQRRNQKILEEAPAPGVGESLRSRMGEAAVALAREVGYRGAGTVEFLLAPDGAFYFLEMNTRLQVEHPVTEAVTGLDLVEWQLRIARGEALPCAQSAIRFGGHAIEARLCAEDAWHGFVPQVGRITGWRVPVAAGVRVDHGLGSAPEVPPYYDSMIAKVVAAGRDREEARARLVAALEHTTVMGVVTNRDYLLACLRAPRFVEASLATRWLGEASATWAAPRADARWLAVAAALRLAQMAAPHGALAGFSSRGRRTAPLVLDVQGRTHALRLEYGSDGVVRVESADATHEVEVAWVAPHDAPPAIGERAQADVAHAGAGVTMREVRLDGMTLRVAVRLEARGGWLDALGTCAGFDDVSDAPPRRSARGGDGTIVSTMHGQLVKLAVAPGQRVARGEFLLAIEAMKMEHRIESPIEGTVSEIAAQPGTQVAPGRLLLRIDASEPGPAA